MALGPTFWARKFGMVTDKFGTPWMINCGMIDSNGDCVAENEGTPPAESQTNATAI